MQEVLQASANNFWVLGISRFGKLYYLFSSRLGNILETWFDGWLEVGQSHTVACHHAEKLSLQGVTNH